MPLSFYTKLKMTLQKSGPFRKVDQGKCLKTFLFLKNNLTTKFIKIPSGGAPNRSILLEIEIPGIGDTVRNNIADFLESPHTFAERTKFDTNLSCDFFIFSLANFTSKMLRNIFFHLSNLKQILRF